MKEILVCRNPKCDGFWFFKSKIQNNPDHRYDKCFHKNCDDKKYPIEPFIRLDNLWDGKPFEDPWLTEKKKMLKVK